MSKQFDVFRAKIWSHYHMHGRDVPWRKTTDPYKILVSEVMLQQTQVSRVIPKYRSFLRRFPHIKALAQASLSDVLSEWKGLGYNRRGKALYDIACLLFKEKRDIPRSVEELDALPMIGPNTAASIAAFAYNMPTVFIETNIRTVFIHFFFDNTAKVHDADVLELVRRTLDMHNPREWYYALMDYGHMLKATVGNANVRSVHYRTQSPFKGSNRELRSRLLDSIRNNRGSIQALRTHDVSEEKILRNLIALEREGFIVRQGVRYVIRRTPLDS